MSAYLVGRYDAAIAGISAWLDAGPEGDELRLAPLAASAMAGVRRLVAADAALAERSAALAERLRALAPAAPANA